MAMNQTGSFELKKFAHRKAAYAKSVDEILQLGFDAHDYLHHFPAFVGHLTLARFITLYELYKQTLGVAGHIAEIGVYKAAGSLFFAKLLRLFEPETLTLVHGFDWFQGAKVSAEEKFVADGECLEDYGRVLKLISLQGLDNIVHIHNLDVTKELDRFFSENTHLQFKLIFVDCGIYDVVAATITHFWPRLSRDGIMVFDHFNHEVAPGETRAIRELLPQAKMRNFRFGWMPTAYVVKE
jgi:hypothetical protein